MVAAEGYHRRVSGSRAERRWGLGKGAALGTASARGGRARSPAGARGSLGTSKSSGAEGASGGISCFCRPVKGTPQTWGIWALGKSVSVSEASGQDTKTLKLKPLPARGMQPAPWEEPHPGRALSSCPFPLDPPSFQGLASYSVFLFSIPANLLNSLSHFCIKLPPKFTSSKASSVKGVRDLPPGAQMGFLFPPTKP